jgi:hypothetical protein
MAKKILLVEGPDDEHVFKALCGSHDLPRLDEIKPYEGYTNLLDAFPLRLTESDVDVVGVVLDADTDLDARWRAVRDRLLEAGYLDVPITLPNTGLILDPPQDKILSRVGVWLMPDNTVPGILENFLHHLVPDGDRLFEYAGSCLDGIAPELRLFRDEDRPKALIHTWLAWQNEPGKPLGQSITRGVLQADIPAALMVVAWLKNLFSN